MKERKSRPVPQPGEEKPQTLFNKTFYQFLFSFIAVIAGVLVFVLVLGVQVR